MIEIKDTYTKDEVVDLFQDLINEIEREYYCASDIYEMTGNKTYSGAITAFGICSSMIGDLINEHFNE